MLWLFGNHKKKIASFFGLVWPPIMVAEMADILLLSSFPFNLFWTKGINCASKDGAAPKHANTMTKRMPPPLEMQLKLPKIQNPKSQIVEWEHLLTC